MSNTEIKLPDNYTLSVVIPAYNEAENLVPLADELYPILKKTGRSFEVIFVDDASTDNSLEILRNIKKKYPEVKAISFEQNCGQTSAFDAGFKTAKGDVIITMDADLQNDPNDIPKLLEKIGEYDMVTGWRWQRRDTFIRRISSKIANAVRRRGLEDPFHDTGCSLKAFRREPLMKIRLFNFMHRFLPILFAIDGCSVAEVKVNHRERTRGKTKYGVRNRILRSWRAMKFVKYMQTHNLNYKIKEKL